MSINILDLVKDQVTGALASQASSFLGESESGITKALGGMMPAILGGAIEKASAPGGGQGLMDMIGGLDLGKLGDIAGIFGGGASEVNNVMNSGGGILESLLGSKTSGIIDLISGMAGLKKNSTGSLLKLAAPFIMGVIGKQIKGKGLSFLSDLLMGQKDHVAKAMPAGMGNLLGFSSLGNMLGGAGDAVKNTAAAATGAARSAATSTVNASKEAASTGMGWIKWALPLLLIGGLAWWFLGKGNPADMVKDGMETVGDAAGNAANAVGDAAAATGDAVADAANATMDWAKGAFATIDEAGKAALDKITFTAGSAGEQMMGYINGGFEGEGTFRFKDLNFATGSAKLDAAAQAEVDGLATILKAYPGVKVEVQGHTDNTGDAAANKQLSAERAGAVMGRLIAQGIDAGRVTSAGYGAEMPVADNGTEEGRAQNRRTEVKLMK